MTAKNSGVALSVSAHFRPVTLSVSSDLRHVTLRESLNFREGDCQCPRGVFWRCSRRRDRSKKVKYVTLP